MVLYDVIAMTKRYRTAIAPTGTDHNLKCSNNHYWYSAWPEKFVGKICRQLNLKTHGECKAKLKRLPL